MIARIEQPNRWTAAVLQQLNHWFVLLCVLSHAFCCKTKQNWIEVDPVCAEPEGLKTTKSKSEFILSRWRCSDWNSAIYSLSSNLVNLMGVKSKPFNRLFIAFMYWYNTICRANVGAGDACDCIYFPNIWIVEAKNGEKTNSHDKKHCVQRVMGVNCLDNGP